MNVIGAGLGGDIDYAAAGLAVFRRIRRRLHRELLNRLRREAHDRSRDSHAGVVGAIREDESATGTAAPQAQVETWRRHSRGYSRIFAANYTVHVGGGNGQIKDAAVEQRDVLDLAFGNSEARSTRFGVDQRSVRRDVDDLRHRTHMQGDILRYRGRRIHLDVFDDFLFKTGSLDFN